MNSPLTKSSYQSQSLKKEFSQIVEQIEKQFKRNNTAYREKYFELARYITDLHTETKKCYQKILIEKQVTQREEEYIFDTSDIICDPIIFIDHFHRFCSFVTEYCLQFKLREEKVKEQILEMYKMDNNHSFLEALAKKNLENFDLKIEVEELEAKLKVLHKDVEIAEEIVKQYKLKFKQFADDYDKVIVSISQIMKKSQSSDIELRQENRFQKEMIQSHKIEFERYKKNVKMRPALQQKQNKLRAIIEKQFQNREKQLIKQTEKIVENRLRGVLFN